MPMAWLIGWLSSVILLVTLAKQVHKQWREGRAEGVSKWLFRGQIAASIGFTTYSFLIRQWLFVVTNALILTQAIIGFFVTRRNVKARERAGATQRQQPTPDRSIPTPPPGRDWHRIPS